MGSSIYGTPSRPRTQARVEAEALKVLSDLRRSEDQLEAALEAAEERGLVDGVTIFGGFHSHGGTPIAGWYWLMVDS